jgi:hypothetical protein
MPHLSQNAFFKYVTGVISKIKYRPHSDGSVGGRPSHQKKTPGLWVLSGPGWRQKTVQAMQLGQISVLEGIYLYRKIIRLYVN